jgi:hypothetical protein
MAESKETRAKVAMTPAVTALLHRLRTDTLRVKHSYYEWSKQPTYCHTAWVNEALQVGAVRNDGKGGIVAE